MHKGEIEMKISIAYDVPDDEYRKICEMLDWEFLHNVNLPTSYEIERGDYTCIVETNDEIAGAQLMTSIWCLISR